MKVLVCGSRNWDCQSLVDVLLDGLLTSHPGWHKHLKLREGDAPELTIVHGDAKGADSQASDWADVNSMPERACPADWSLGKTAGPMRNHQMLTQEKPDIVVAFKQHLNPAWREGDAMGIGGTENMCKIARQAGVPVITIDCETPELLDKLLDP